MESSAKTPAAASTLPIDQWRLFQRVQDVRVVWHINLVRTVAVVAFYAIHLAWFLGLAEPTEIQRSTNLYAGAIAVAWLILCVGIFLAVQIRFVPRWAKYCITTVDVLLLTSAAAIGAQTGSWLILGYFLVIAAASMRFEPPLVLIATVLSLMGYLLLVGLADDVWFDENHGTPLGQVATVMVGIALAGTLGWLQCANCRNWFDTAVHRKG